MSRYTHPLARLGFLIVCVSTQKTRVALRQEQAAKVGGGGLQTEAREESPPFQAGWAKIGVVGGELWDLPNACGKKNRRECMKLRPTLCVRIVSMIPASRPLSKTTWKQPNVQ